MYHRRNAGEASASDPAQHTAATTTQTLYGTTGSTFEIAQALGGGGTSHVYLARLHKHQSGFWSDPVALKLLRPGAATTVRRLFYHEGALLPRLQHPQIVRYRERGRGVIPGFGTLDYLALEYVAGHTLDDLMRRQGSALSPGTVLGIVAQIVSGLEYLHQRGIVHGDLKPSNIMVERAVPRAVLVDFGSARTPNVLSQSVAVGTPQYMAPEQAHPGRACDRRADVYALGVVIYELLVGRRLFPHRSIADLRRDTPQTSEPVLHSLDVGVSRVLARCVSYEPNRRYATATALLNDLREPIRHLLC